jgi:PAS domain S-box-containing protein
MDIYAWASISASIVSVALGVTVFLLNRRNLLNKLFISTCVIGFFWTFTEFMMWQSSNAEIANFWSNMGFIWPFFVALVLHFSLLYTQNRWLKNKLTYVALYAPAAIFAIIDFSTDLINSTPILEYWGYEDTAPATLAYNVSTIWVSLLPILALMICLRYYITTLDESKKKQSKYVTVGLAIPIISYVITNVVFPSFAINIPNLGHIATLFFAIFVGYAILKYELFTFDAAMAAENIILTIPDPLFLADLTGKILRTNKRLLDFIGFEESELVGEYVSKLYAENGQYAIVIEALSKEGIVKNRELPLKTKTGEIKTVLFSGSIVRSRTGREVGFVCVLRDISDRNEMEKRLVKAERLASIGELAGQIGHDLRNPLTGIKTGIYYLQKKGDKLTDIDRKATLEVMNNAIEDSNRIINSLVDYSSELSLRKDKCTLKSLLAGALSKVQVPDRITIVNQTNGEFELELALPEMERVFLCLIQNAIEAIPDKGTLEISNMQKGENLEVSFIDSGSGISKEVLPKIFSPLVTTKAKGMGMSLAICKRIVDAQGGKIVVESTMCKGTTFTVTLPIASKIQFEVASEWAKNRVPV